LHLLSTLQLQKRDELNIHEQNYMGKRKEEVMTGKFTGCLRLRERKTGKQSSILLTTPRDRSHVE